MASGFLSAGRKAPSTYSTEKTVLSRETVAKLLSDRLETVSKLSEEDCKKLVERWFSKHPEEGQTLIDQTTQAVDDHTWTFVYSYLLVLFQPKVDEIMKNVESKTKSD